MKLQLYVLMYVCCALSGTKINAILLTLGPCQVAYSPFLAAACVCLTFCLGLVVGLVPRDDLRKQMLKANSNITEALTVR